MNVADLLSRAPRVLAEGSVIELLLRSDPARLSPQLLNAPLVLDDPGRAILAPIYSRYIAAAHRHGLPMLVLTPTWRANLERLRAGGLEHADVNGTAVRFLDELRREADSGPRGPIYVGGLVGCRGDAYQTAEALSRAAAAAFHGWQAEALAAAGPDLLLAETLPAVSEALGLADALAATGLPYVLSVVVRADGCLLDRTPLGAAIDEIDNEVFPQPLGYMINCVHAAIAGEALERERQRHPEVLRRVLGLKANTSRLAPEELDGRAELDGMEPAAFARGMLQVHREFGLRLLGGCCGTDHRHIDALAAVLAEENER